MSSQWTAEMTIEWTGPTYTGSGNNYKESDKTMTKQTETINFNLYSDIAPKTANNFRALCAGDSKDPKATYSGAIFHRIIESFMLQGGDFNKKNGTGGYSVYGEKFEDENFTKKHNVPFLLSMANAGPRTNGSQFFITTVPTPHLDGKHVVFGEVADDKSKAFIKSIEHVAKGSQDKPTPDVTIKSCKATSKEDAAKTWPDASKY